MRVKVRVRVRPLLRAASYLSGVVRWDLWASRSPGDRGCSGAGGASGAGAV